MVKKGQAAMEFLMTYGWAILVVLAAIGALAYFGVLSPKNLLPSSCTVGAGFGCSEYKATATNISMKIRNNAGEDLSLVSIIWSGDMAGCSAMTVTASPACTWINNVCNSTACQADCITAAGLRNGKDLGTFSATCTGKTGTVTGDFNIIYQKTGEGVTHTGTGKYTFKIET